MYAILDYHLNQMSTFVQNFEANQVILKDVFFSRKQFLDWKIPPSDTLLWYFVALNVKQFISVFFWAVICDANSFLPRKKT